VTLPAVPPDEKTTACSPASPRYNCVAWALGDPRVRWWPFDPSDVTSDAYYWPDGLPTTESLAAFDGLFRSFGFEACETASLESGFEKIAVYCDPAEDIVTHAAWQIVDGRWASKMGSIGSDVLHLAPEDMDSVAYGVVKRLYKRRRQRWEIPIDPFGAGSELSPTAPLGTVTTR
jgi:hypothetical protein